MKINDVVQKLIIQDIKTKIDKLYYDIDFLKDELLNKENISTLEINKMLEFVNRLHKDMKKHLKEMEDLINKIDTKK
jgi:hypothetical protein